MRRRPQRFARLQRPKKRVTSKSTQPFQVVMVTVANRQNAKLIATNLLQQRLAACVNLIPALTSIFRWRGKIEQAQEILLLIKTRKSHLTRLRKLIHEHHTYDVPEIISVPLVWGDRTYLAWLKNETDPKEFI